MGAGECSSCGSLGRDGVGVSSSFERDMGADGTLKSLFICTGSNHGIGSRMSIGPGVMFEGGVMVWETMSLGVPVGAVYCGTAIVSVGDSVDMTGSEVMQLGDDSLGDVRSATVSVGITVDTGMLSLMGSSTSMLRRPVGSWGRGLSRLHCANVTL